MNLLLLPIGTKIRVKESVDCHQMFKDGGTLVKQRPKDREKGEYIFGINALNKEKGFKGSCYDFKSKEYELI